MKPQFPFGQSRKAMQDTPETQDTRPRKHGFVATVTVTGTTPAALSLETVEAVLNARAEVLAYPSAQPYSKRAEYVKITDAEVYTLLIGERV